MNVLLVGTILRSLGLLATLQNQVKLGQSLNGIAALMDAGQNVDNHLRLVGEALQAGNEPDFDDIRARIEAESDRLQSP